VPFFDGLPFHQVHMLGHQLGQNLAFVWKFMSEAAAKDAG
jgi:hypothetical protein